MQLCITIFVINTTLPVITAIIIYSLLVGYGHGRVVMYDRSLLAGTDTFKNISSFKV